MAKVVWSYLLFPGELTKKWRSAPEYKYCFLNNSQRDTVHKDLLFLDWRPRVKYSFLYHPSSFLTNFSWYASVISSRKLIKNRILLLNWGFTMRQQLIYFTSEYLIFTLLRKKFNHFCHISLSETFVPA